MLPIQAYGLCPHDSRVGEGWAPYTKRTRSKRPSRVWGVGTVPGEKEDSLSRLRSSAAGWQISWIDRQECFVR